MTATRREPAESLTESLISARMWDLLREEFPDRSPAALGVQVEECLRFLSIASEVGGCFIPLSKEIDEIWHALVVQTRSYAQLCERLPGKAFVHHESLKLSAYAETVGRSAAVREFVAWIPRYVGRFGDFTEERAQYWRVCTFLRVELGLSLREINEMGRRMAAGNDNQEEEHRVSV
ncbi:hypothetical protein [Asanoa iriomotensis]|uniref:Uncharacterized protein n=1 Tax=Asanoa iriomotensis TaxID=234613 RepID=A0ABQ4C3W5_9ACTN|nr:hypothetical protein [Asanoa iriomotensis]GIF57457.1 hypothetical protein Air01nite_35520 [Asanoa iriomotensis]